VVIAAHSIQARFATGEAFRGYTGLTPEPPRPATPTARASRCRKAGSRLLWTTLIRAADNARHQDPQLATIYYFQMVERGKDHLGALCVVAANLAERFWAVMNRGRPLPRLRHQQHSNRPRSGQSDHRRLLAGACRSPSPPPQQEGKAPQTVRTGQSKPPVQRESRRGDLPRPAWSATPPDEVNRNACRTNHHRESGQPKLASGVASCNVEVFQMVSVRTPIFGRPRPLTSQRRAGLYTLTRKS